MTSPYIRSQFDSLSLENTDAAIEQLNTACVENLIEYRSSTFCNLLMEDIFIDYRKQNENAPFDVSYRRSARALKITISVQSDRLNVLHNHEYTEQQLSGLALQPTWKYWRGKNIVVFSLPVPMPTRESLNKIIEFMAGEKTAFRRGVVMRILNMAMLVLEPWLAAKIIEGLSDGDVNMIVTNALFFLVVELSSSLYTYFGTCNLERAYHAMVKEVRNVVTEHVLRIKTEHVDVTGTGVFTERIIGETYNVANGINNMVLVLTELFRLVSLLIAFASISPIITAYEMLLFAVYLLIVHMQSKSILRDSQRVNVAAEAFAGLVGETVRASRDIKLLHCEESFLVKARDVVDTLNERSIARRIRTNKHELGRSQFIAFANCIFLIIIAILIWKFGLLPSVALVLYAYNGKLYDSAVRISSATDAYYALLLSAERVYQLIDSDDFSKETFGDKNLESVDGTIDLTDVSFSYTPKGHAPVPVIKDMNLHISAGQSVALVGRNGCGKSTLLSLIARLYDPSDGSILLDGTDASELSQDTIRNSIGTVSQSPYLFNVSVRDNFALVKSDVTDEEIIEVCKVACVHDDIMRLPKGYDTVVGEGGCMLSGGQRQRIAIARALMKNYPIIMLDEATSALDNETQAAICEAIRNMHGKRTVVMIAHRLSVVRDFDQLMYLQDGKVLAAGTHDELMSTCEPYRKLYAEESA